MCKNERKLREFLQKKRLYFMKYNLIVVWALTDSNRRPSACKADALNQLS